MAARAVVCSDLDLWPASSVPGHVTTPLTLGLYFTWGGYCRVAIPPSLPVDSPAQACLPSLLTDHSVDTCWMLVTPKRARVLGSGKVPSSLSLAVRLLHPLAGAGLEGLISSDSKSPGQPRAGLCSEVRDQGAKGDTETACPPPSSKHHCWWDSGAPLTRLNPN